MLLLLDVSATNNSCLLEPSHFAPTYPVQANIAGTTEYMLLTIPFLMIPIPIKMIINASVDRAEARRQQYRARRASMTTEQLENTRARARERYARRRDQRNLDNLEGGNITYQNSVVASDDFGTIDVVYRNLPDATQMLQPQSDCPHCGAKRFQYESPGFCCKQGKVKLVMPQPPEELHLLYTTRDADSQHFLDNTRFFNGHFSFTTFNCEYDQNLASSRDGVYTFKAHGQVYHRIHSFGRRESDPKHLELYFYDDDPLLSHRMRLARDEVFKAKDQNVMTKLANLLRENPYAETFRSIGQYGNIDEYRIDLNTDYKLDQRTFNTPTSSEVAAVWVEGTELHRQFERGVTLYGNDNAFYSIKPHHGCYDPLAYPLFFPRGELGWHSGIPKVGVNTARIDGRQSTDSDNPG